MLIFLQLFIKIPTAIEYTETQNMTLKIISIMLHYMTKNAFHNEINKNSIFFQVLCSVHML